MFLPKGYLTFQQAAAVVPDIDEDGGYERPKAERLGAALASGELVAHGIVVGAEWDGEVHEEGEIQQLRPETWRKAGAKEAVVNSREQRFLAQGGFFLVPIIEQSSFYEWCRQQYSTPQQDRVPDLSFGVHALPAGYIAFDQIPTVARVWAKAGKIDPDILALLDPPDTDSMTEALASGALPAFGISKQSGRILHLPASTWRMEIEGRPQSIWAIAGSEVMSGPEGEACLPVLARADLARALGAREVPPDPPEKPDRGQHVQPIEKPPPRDAAQRVADWMRGYAAGFKVNGKLAKRDDAIAAAREANSCTVRQAEAAFEALPYPELRNPPRTPGA